LTAIDPVDFKDIFLLSIIKQMQQLKRHGVQLKIACESMDFFHDLAELGSDTTAIHDEPR